MPKTFTSFRKESEPRSAIELVSIALIKDRLAKADASQSGIEHAVVFHQLRKKLQAKLNH